MSVVVPKWIVERRVFVDPRQRFRSWFFIAGPDYTIFRCTSLLNLVTWQYTCVIGLACGQYLRKIGRALFCYCCFWFAGCKRLKHGANNFNEVVIIIARVNPLINWWVFSNSPILHTYTHIQFIEHPWSLGLISRQPTCRSLQLTTVGELFQWVPGVSAMNCQRTQICAMVRIVLLEYVESARDIHVKHFHRRQPLACL